MSRLKKWMKMGLLGQGGAGIDYGPADLTARIAWWQADTLVAHSGLRNEPVIGTSQAYGSTFFSIANLHRIRQWGQIRRVRPYIKTLGDGNIKIKAFRWNGSLFTYVGGTGNIALTQTGVQNIDLPAPITVRPGDYLAFYGNYLNAGVNSIGVAVTVETDQMRYAIADTTTNNTFAAEPVLTMTVQAIGYDYRPYLCVTGDSIAAGFNGWKTHYDNWGGTAIANDFSYQLAQLHPTMKYQNYGKGSQTWAWVRATAVPDLLAAQPYTVIIHCGVNDVQQARQWADVEADMRAVISALKAGGVRKVLIDEILPWTNGNDTQAGTIRTWNASYATVCASAGATLIPCHDPMGQIRVSTGELDDLITANQSDGVHLNSTGAAALAAIQAPYL